MKSIAILICTYKGDKPEHLNEMFQSVKNAALPANYGLRIYLHIDGPISDDTKAVIDSHDIYKTIHSNSSIGLANGLNKLILAREGEDFFFRMDADDICCQQRFIKQLRFMEENPSVDFSGGNISEFLGDVSNVVYTRRYPVLHRCIVTTLVKASPFAHVTICFRNTFFDKFSLYPTEYTLCEDIAYWYQCLSRGAKSANIDEVLVNVRMDGAYSRRGVVKAIAEFRIYWNIVKWAGHGFHYPVFRLLFRLFPISLVKLIYNSELRTMLVKKR